jgi:hypothetical protein
MESNPPGGMGLPDYLGWKWKSLADIRTVCVPGCRVPPDNFMRNMTARRTPEAPVRMRTVAGAERTVPLLVDDGKVIQVGWQGRGFSVEAE